MDASYIESVWWSLKQIYDKGLLVQDHRVAPYCPRCGTGLSDHEVAQGYQTVVDPSVYVRFPVTSGPLAELGAALLVWTTTPWTLVSNTAVAVHPSVTYVAARVERRGAGRRRAAAARAGRGRRGAVVASPAPRWSALTYARPFDWLDIPDAHYVGLADYVTTESGTGLVHQAPAFGAEDLAGRAPLRAAGGQPDPAGRHLRRRCAAGRRAVLQGGRPGAGAGPRGTAACCSASSPTSTPTRTAGAATPRCSTTRCRPGTSAPPPSRTGCSRRTTAPTGTRRPSRPAGTATGWRTTSTGRCRGTATGALPCRSGGAPTTT